jgi:hypothetical protein
LAKTAFYFLIAGKAIYMGLERRKPTEKLGEVGAPAIREGLIRTCCAHRTDRSSPSKADP